MSTFCSLSSTFPQLHQYKNQHQFQNHNYHLRPQCHMILWKSRVSCYLSANSAHSKKNTVAKISIFLSLPWQMLHRTYLSSFKLTIFLKCWSLPCQKAFTGHNSQTSVLKLAWYSLLQWNQTCPWFNTPQGHRFFIFVLCSWLWNVQHLSISLSNL